MKKTPPAREACSTPDSQDKLRGVIEIDEAFFGGKERNKHKSKKLNVGSGSAGKTAVLGIRQRGGDTRAMVPHSPNTRQLGAGNERF